MLGLTFSSSKCKFKKIIILMVFIIYSEINVHSYDVTCLNNFTGFSKISIIKLKFHNINLGEFNIHCISCLTVFFIFPKTL